MFPDATISEINTALEQAWRAFHQYRKTSLKQRAEFMRTIASLLDNAPPALLETAMAETHLGEARLRSEKQRTAFQLTSYADAAERGDWLEARIDTADDSKNPPRPDLRKMAVPLGPVVVFGASNFPFAYSTAGGDTACALAAGCPVIVKAHPAHAKTSEMVAAIILQAAKQCKMPEGVFTHVHGASFEVGKALVTHPHTKAVGFTGSFNGGMALFDWANQRKEPIPVFAEMGSINPVFLLPGKLTDAAAEFAKKYAESITQSVGQFCTNPGLLVAFEGKGLDDFLAALSDAIHSITPGTMLHPGIAKAFAEKRTLALQQQGVETLAVSDTAPEENQGIPTIASVSATAFIENPALHQEVFGPYSLVVRCKDVTEMLQVITHLEGQLTASLIATDEEVKKHAALVEAITNICGRFILNGVPTGVAVALSMQHGGPFPATTDSRFTSVGADGIKRFARPVAYQNWSDDLLPDALKNSNPLGIWRTVNNEMTKSAIEKK